MEIATMIPARPAKRPTDPFRSAIHPRLSDSSLTRRRRQPQAPGREIDPLDLRNTLGHVPTGVVIVTAMGDGEPIGVAIGSFVSISLAPPLVGFFSDISSTTLPKLLSSGKFCVNVLGANRAELGKAFSRRGQDRFNGIDWSPGETGSPALRDAIAWIECHIDEELALGDHTLVVGRVHRLGVNETVTDPVGLAFYRGGFSDLGPRPAHDKEKH